MHVNAATAETTVPSISNDQSTGSSLVASLYDSAPPERTIAGMESKNEKRAAAVLVRPNISAAVMVMPEREVPGIKAMA